jgi:mRNA interferase HigB
MEILNKRIIDDFVSNHASSAGAVDRWLEQMGTFAFSNHNELKQNFPSADYIGKSRYVFNIKGNDYRLVAVVVFAAGQVFICFIGTHAEYDKIDCLTVLK